MYLNFLILSSLIVLSAIFSGSETALMSLTNSKVDELAENKVRNSKLLKKLKKNPHKLLITVLIGNNIVNIAASAYAAVLFDNIFGSHGVAMATGIMTFLILVFGEITPKSFAHQHAVGVSLFIIRPIYILQTILYPLVCLFEKLVKLSDIIFGAKKSVSVTEGELVAMVKIGAKEGSIEHQEKEFIENVLEFNDIKVNEVMTPRVTIEAIDCEISIQEAVNYAIKHSHSRLPVYRDNIDNIIGIISIKELLKFFDKYSPNKKIKTLQLSRPLEVPRSKKINKLFREFQRKHIHIAVVIDKYGGTAGLVTLEDLLEEIVGEIVDEFDKQAKPLKVVDKNTIIVGGDTLIEDINDYYMMKFGENEHDTLNNMITEKLHRFPREGEVIELDRAKVQILEMKKKLVSKARITKIKKKKKV